MKITLHPTTLFQTVDGIPCRRWDGQTDKGTDVICFIALIGVREGRQDELRKAGIAAPEVAVLTA